MFEACLKLGQFLDLFNQLEIFKLKNTLDVVLLYEDPKHSATNIFLKTPGVILNNGNAGSKDPFCLQKHSLQKYLALSVFCSNSNCTTRHCPVQAAEGDNM